MRVLVEGVVDGVITVVALDVAAAVELEDTSVVDGAAAVLVVACRLSELLRLAVPELAESVVASVADTYSPSASAAASIMAHSR